MNHTRPLASIVFLVSIAFPFAACKPDLGDRESLVTRMQVLAVRGEPPEAKPGEVARYELLVATPDGPVTAPIASWAFCASPKLLTENGAASAACLQGNVRPVADGMPFASAAIPADACSLFGPEIAAAELRPRDPDVTGGFYQPLRVTVFGPEGQTIALGLERLGCRLANAAADVTADFGKRYVANKNPDLLPLAVARDGAPLTLDAIPRGSKVTLRASWSDASPERYVVYDLASRAVVERRETMRVSWFATAGTFESDRTGRSEDELETFTENAWTAPTEPRTTHLFVVLRDARGGVAYATHELVTR